MQQQFLLGFLILKVNKIKCFISKAMNIDGDNLDTESNDHCKDEDNGEVEKLRGRQSIMA